MFKGTILVGRDSEIEVLQECLSSVVKGQGRMVFIAAEPGGGKTELVKEFLKSSSTGCFIAEVNCEPHKKEWGAFNEFLEVINKLPSSSYKGLSPILDKSINATKKSASALASLIPVVGTPIASGITIFDNFRKEFKEINFEVVKDSVKHIHNSIISPLISYTKNVKQPIIIFFDDLHLASNTSLQLIVSLGNELKEKPFGLLFIGTYRAREIAEDPSHLLPGILNSLRKIFTINPLQDNKSSFDKPSEEKFLHLIDLKPFEIQTINTVISKIFSNNCFPEDFANKIFDITNGNPMFVDTFLRCLHDQKIIIKNPACKYELLNKQLEDIPLNLNESIAKRLNKLDKEFRGILNYASVLGTCFELNMLGRMSSIDKFRLAEKLNDLEVNYNLVSPNEQIDFEKIILRYYSFTHILIRKYAYDTIAPSMRSVYHMQAAEIIKYFYGEDLEKYPEQFEEYKNHIRASKGLLNGITLKLTDSAELPDTLEIYTEWKQIVDDEIQKAVNFFTQNLTADAINSLKKAENILNEAGSKLDNYISLRFTLHLYKTLLYLKSSLFYFAYKESSILIIYALKLENSVELSKAYIVRHIVFKALKMLNEAEDLMQKAYGLDGNQEAGERNIFFFNYIGRFFDDVGYYKIAIDLYQRGLENAKKKGESSSIATYFNNIGVTYMNLQKSTESIECFKQAIDSYPNDKDQNTLLIFLRNLALSYTRANKNNKALEVRIRILDLYLDTGKKDLIAKGYEEVGIAHFKLNNFKESESNIIKALEFYEEIGDQEKIKQIKEIIKTISLKMNENNN